MDTILATVPSTVHLAPPKPDGTEAGLSLRVLYVEDNPEQADLVLRRFEGFRLPIEVLWHQTLLGAIEALARERVDVALLDLGLPELEGSRSHKAINIVAPGVPVVVLTANTDEQVRREVQTLGVAHYLVKSETTLDDVVRNVLLASMQSRPRSQRDTTSQYGFC